ncbi:hypothetical protein [Streptomyces yangpuensis]|uniref:hypothetical protein n=1 Tax=Streptomyces yangpuensis TaxID=1648182 RepID=UPI000699ADE3|nr:hypothetical protein [Streptomyces yangpuensis]
MRGRGPAARYGAGGARLARRNGRVRPAPPGPASTTAPITLDEEEIGALRLERTGPPRLPLDRVAALLCPGRPVKAAPLADAGILVTATDTDTAADSASSQSDLLPAGVRAGVGAAGEPVRSWREARTALRFTAERRPAVRYADLGALLAEIPEDVARAHHDVAALALIAWRMPDN